MSNDAETTTNTFQTFRGFQQSDLLRIVFIITPYLVYHVSLVIEDLKSRTSYYLCYVHGKRRFVTSATNFKVSFSSWYNYRMFIWLGFGLGYSLLSLIK